MRSEKSAPGRHSPLFDHPVGWPAVTALSPRFWQRRHRRFESKAGRQDRMQQDGEAARLSSNRHARGCTQGVPEGRGVLVVDNLPREDGCLPGYIDDRLARPRRKAIGFIWCRLIGIGIAVGWLPSGGFLFPAYRVQSYLGRVRGSRPCGRSLNWRPRVVRATAVGGRCDIAEAKSNHRDCDCRRHSSRHVISPVDAILITQRPRFVDKKAYSMMV
jgi:hypothetical protein